METAIIALGGVLLGAILSTVSGLLLVRQARVSQARHEVWLRLLNSYQDFSNFSRQLMDFANGPDELWTIALVGAHKCVNDAATLDSGRPERPKEMHALLMGLQTDAPKTDQERGAMKEAVDAIFADFRAEYLLS